MVSGTYISSFGKRDELDPILKRVKKFEDDQGRRPRIMIAKMGQDGHDRGMLIYIRNIYMSHWRGKQSSSSF